MPALPWSRLMKAGAGDPHENDDEDGDEKEDDHEDEKEDNTCVDCKYSRATPFVTCFFLSILKSLNIYYRVCEKRSISGC